MRLVYPLVITSTVSIVSTGCGGESSAIVDSRSTTSMSVDRTRYLLAEEPDGAIGVIEARESAADGAPIVLVGRIGGAANPWVEGRAAFMLLDASKVVVADGAECCEEEICLDDCCAEDRAACTTLVKVVDESGSVLAADARELFGLAANDLVVVRGKVRKDAEGNFTVLADGVHVRQ